MLHGLHIVCIHVCTISEDIGVNKEKEICVSVYSLKRYWNKKREKKRKEICLPNICDHRSERKKYGCQMWNVYELQ